MAAAMGGVPTAILEQNSIPGITNRMLGKVARRAFIAFGASRRFFPRKKTTLAGNPIRARLRTAQASGGGPPTLLVVGGSQGAHAVNELVAGAIEAMARTGRPLPRIVHQTGASDVESVAARYRALGAEADVRAFIDDMAAAYAAADLVVCRAGATTIAELTALGRPAIFVPFPFAADDHQYHNAKALADAGAALVYRQDAIEPAQLAAEMGALFSDGARRERMRAAMLALGKPDAARDIVDALEKLVA
jgi:UDP-N-acetylglucosamine--N-acetylmuramyl-(pentapeptide) pyrophosphoryl-undecaprenol N-acetylglucosamine transferase